MRDIRATIEVRALIGTDKLRELHSDAFGRYECWRCGGSGRTTEPTSVIVLGYRVFRVVRLAHAACAESQIIKVGPDRLAGFDAPGFGDTHARSAVRPGRAAPAFRFAAGT